jgi:preprotein translocase subunit YajC
METIIGFLPLILIFLIFYFLVIVPQRRRQQELQAVIDSLKVGDTVVTGGGLVGKIIELRDKSGDYPLGGCC